MALNRYILGKTRRRFTMKHHSNRTIKSISFLLVLALFLTGCGSGGQSETGSGSREASPSSAAADDRERIDWGSHQPVPAQSAIEGDSWYLTEYYGDWITSPQQEYDYSYPCYAVSPDGVLCCFTQYFQKSEDAAAKTSHMLDYFDTATGEAYHTQINLTDWGLPQTANLMAIDIVEDKQIVCLFHAFEGSDLSHCSLVYYHMEEGVLKTLDLLPAMLSAGISESSIHIERVVWTPNGNGYILTADTLLMIKDTGESAGTLTRSEDTPLSYLCKTPEGFPLFVLSDKGNKSNDYLLGDSASGELRSIGQANYMALSYGCVDPYGSLYTLSKDNVVRWDTNTGAREKIFACSANAICTNLLSEKKMGIRSDGNLVIMDPHTANRNIYVLSPVPLAERRTVTLESACYIANTEKTAAAVFSRDNPNIHIAYTGISNSDDLDTYTTNLLNRIVAGDIPDMMIVYSDTMQLLYEKGILADLSDMIPADLQEQVFGCVWNAGTIDGKLTGLTTSLSCTSMLVSRDVCPEETWTLEDMLALADSSDPDTLKGLIPLYGALPEPETIVYQLALAKIDSSLVDWETGVCHFDNDTFRRLLEYAKNTPIPDSNPAYSDPLPARAVRNGEYLAYACDIYNFSNFSSQMSRFDESYHWIGVPNDSGNGNLVSASSFLVVNKNSENLDIIRQFLPTLYAEEVERKHPDSCLRRDILRKSIYLPEWEDTVQFNMGEGTFLILEGKPDGTSYVEEYIEFMDSCVPYSPRDWAIASIVMEEAAAYFSGDKDIDTVVNIIQNRVQLYLDENT